MHLKRKKVKMFRIFFKKPLAAHTYNTPQNQIVFQVAIDSLSCCNWTGYKCNCGWIHF